MYHQGLLQFKFEKSNRKRQCFNYRYVQLDRFRGKTRVFSSPLPVACAVQFCQLSIKKRKQCCSPDCSGIGSFYQTNMDNRKRPLSPSSTSSDGFKTPDRRVSVVNGLLNSNFMNWGIEETCQYLRGGGFAEWEEAFRGWCSAFEAVIDRFVFNEIVPRKSDA